MNHSFFNHPIVRELDINEVPRGETRRMWVQLASNGLGWPICAPVIVARGFEEGPIMGVTAVVHGNELNGIPVIQRLFREIDVKKLRGTVVGVLAANIPGFLLGTRRFNDDVDPNHIFPGKADGNNSQVYVNRLINRIVNRFEYLIDLHTASFGRVNSYYIRADMAHPVTRKMAELQNADIIVHNPPTDGTMRGAAEDLGIHAITLEVGDPHRFQKGMIRSGLTGIHNTLIHLKMTEGVIEQLDEGEETVLCDSSFWIYTQLGGLLEVTRGTTDLVKQAEQVGILRNIFGDVVKTYHAPEDGVVIGKSVNPVNQSGGRILHLGRISTTGIFK